MATTKDRIESLRERKAKLDRELKALENKERSETRKRDTRRKVLAGAWLLNQVELGLFNETTLLQGLDQYLEKPRDRELFELNSERQP